jgi:5-methylthioadenosine/S-adenosylhomocysteine deaminase
VIVLLILTTPAENSHSFCITVKTMTDAISIINCTLLTSASAPLQKNVYVSTEKTRVTEIGSMDNWHDSGGHSLIDAGGKLLMPGLVNGHNHCAMTLFRGLADDLALDTWLHDHIFPAERAHVTPEMVYWCTKLAAAEMILSGTTTVADGYFFSGHAATALRDAGMRAVVAHGIVDFSAPSVPDPKKNIEAVQVFIEKWQGNTPRITPAVFAHAPYTCSPETLEKAKDLADRKGVRFFTHIAESKKEQSMIIDPRGATPITHLANLDILDENCTCVHGIWADENDLNVFANSSAAIVTCPQSSMKLASGIAPVQAMHDRGIRVGLGTDGCASNNSLDMFREMDMLAQVQKSATGMATAMNTPEVLRCATNTGAEVIGLSDCGEIGVGKKADLILIDTATPRLTPFNNKDLLVYAASGSDVVTVIIDGELVMRDRQILFFDLEEVYQQVSRFSDKLIAAGRS